MDTRSSVLNDRGDRHSARADDRPGPQDDAFRRIIRQAVGGTPDPSEPAQARREVELRRNRSGE